MTDVTNLSSLGNCDNNQFSYGMDEDRSQMLEFFTCPKRVEVNIFWSDFVQYIYDT